MLGRPGIRDHTVEAGLLGDDGVERFLDALLLGHVAVLKLESSGKALEEGSKCLGRLGDVEAKDAGGVVGKADLRNTEANTLIGTGDCETSS